MSETSLTAIHKKVLAYHKKFNAIADSLKTHADPSIRIEKNKEPILFYIDKEAIGRLMQIAMLDNFDSFAVLFGLEDCGPEKPGAKNKTLNQLTACFLGVDEAKNILPQHLHKTKNKYGKKTPVVFGENTWPPPPPPPPHLAKPVGKNEKKVNKHFTLESKEQDITNYFSVPKSKN